jgi:hypothetical protein
VISTRQRPARRPTALVPTAVLTLAGLVLTGCGTSLGIHPGSAVVVGDRSVSMHTVDSTSDLYCKAYLPTLRQQSSGQVPMRYLRQFVAASLAERLLGEQLAQQYGVTPARGYRQNQTQVQQQFASTPQDQLDAVLKVEGGDPYLQNVQVAVGQQLTGDFGEANSDLKAAQERGQVATQDWLNEHTFSVDPALGVTIEDGRIKLQRDQTSVAVSSLAVAGAQQTGAPDPSYTSALTPAQVCG